VCSCKDINYGTNKRLAVLDYGAMKKSTLQLQHVQYQRPGQ